MESTTRKRSFRIAGYDAERASHRSTRVAILDRPPLWPILLTVTFGLAAAFLTANARTRPLLENTLWLAGGTIVLSLPVGIGLAWLAYRTNTPGASAFRFLLIALLFLPPYLQAAGWDAGFGLQGWFPRWWFPDQAIAPLQGWRGALFLHAIIALPWISLVTGVGLRSVPRELEEAALLDRRAFFVFRQVSWRWTAPLIVAAALWTLVVTASEITITDLYQIRTFAEEIYTGFALGDDLQQVPLRVLPSSLLIFSLAIGSLWATQTFASRTASSIDRQPLVLDLGKARWIAAVILLFAGLFLLGVPLGNLIFKAGLQVEQSGFQRIRVWSVSKFATTLTDSLPRFREELKWSMVLGQLTAISVLICAFSLAWRSQSSRVAAAVGWMLTAAALAIPGPLLALGIGRLINRPHSDWMFYLYDRTLFVPWIALSVRAFPVAFLLATIAVRQIDPRLKETAALDDAERGWALLRWTLPLLAPALGAGWLCALSLALGDLSASILAVPPGVTTVAIRVFNLVHYGVEDQLAGLCLWSTLLFTGLTGVTVQLFRYWGPRNRRIV